MALSESALMYLKNYFVLDETRNEVKTFLEEIAKRSVYSIEEYIKEKNHPLIEFKIYLQKDGSHIQVFYYGSKPLERLEHLDAWKFSIYYYDVMKTTDLSSSTKVKIHGVAPQNKSKQITELKRMSKHLGLPDPYSVTEIDLLDCPLDDVIIKIVNEFTDRYNNFITIIESLIEENKTSSSEGL